MKKYHTRQEMFDAITEFALTVLMVLLMYVGTVILFCL
jgi:hypothetical protein